MGDSMSTIINATTTNGVVIQPDNSGSLVLQTNSGTTALTIDTSQRAAFVAGTAAAPAITTTGDTNTGMFFPAADTIAFAEGGTESMRIDSSGNVGIGTTSPSALLDVNGNLTISGARVIASDFSSSGAANRTKFTTTTTNGNLFAVFSPNGTGNVGAIEIFNTSDVTNSSSIQISSRSDSARVAAGISGTGTYLPLTFFSSNAERMRIDSSGNVGIGTSSPSFTNGSGLFVQRSGGTAAIEVNRSDASIAGSVSLLGGSTQNNIYSVGAKPLVFFTNGSDRMRITSDGEVYIAGNTDRGAFNLQCNGTGVWGAGAYTNGSDERIKENITPIDSGLDVVAKLNPVTYTYKEDWSRDQSIQTGFIAQDLLVALEGKNYVDGIVNQSSEYMSVAYQNIIPLLTKAIQEQQIIINDLKARVEILEAK
jgi:hypothetical protein